MVENCKHLNIFNQYLGECWFNSAIVALFLSDGLKDITKNIFKYYNNKPSAVKYINKGKPYENLIWYNIMYNVMKSLHIMHERTHSSAIESLFTDIIPPLLRRQSSIRKLEESLNIGLNKMSINYNVYIGTRDINSTGDPNHFLELFKEYYNKNFDIEPIREFNYSIDLSDCNACLINFALHTTCIFKCNGKWTYYDTMLDCDEYHEDEFEPINCNTSGKTIAFLNGYEGNDLVELLKSFGEYIDAHPDDYRNNITLMSDDKYEEIRQLWIRDHNLDWNDRGGKVGLWLNTLQDFTKIKIREEELEELEEPELLDRQTDVNNFDTFLNEIPEEDLPSLLHMILGYYKSFYSKVIRHTSIQEMITKILDKDDDIIFDYHRLQFLKFCEEYNDEETEYLIDILSINDDFKNGEYEGIPILFYLANQRNMVPRKAFEIVITDTNKNVFYSGTTLYNYLDYQRNMFPQVREYIDRIIDLVNPTDEETKYYYKYMKYKNKYLNLKKK